MPSAELEKFLINFVVEQTGYPSEMVELDAPCAYILRFLDGGHDRAALLALLESQVAAGVLKLEEEDGTPADPATHGEMLDALLDRILLRIARAGLLMGAE